MARHYYLTRSGVLRRKDNTIRFETSADPGEARPEPAHKSARDASAPGLDSAEGGAGESAANECPDDFGAIPDSGDADIMDSFGDLSLEPELFSEDDTLAGDAPLEAPISGEAVRVQDRRVIPIEDVDALWAFAELELNARVLNFLSQRKVPLHLFNYYGFYSGSFYPREYLNAGYVLVRQVRHYANRRLRAAIAREIVRSALHNIVRNLRYYGTRGIDLQSETEGVQTEILQLDSARTVPELMSCEGRARASYYKGFSKILRDRMEFGKRTRRPPDNPVNALISFTNGLVYAGVLTQIYRSQLNPTISYLHEPGARRFSLALDLAEVFKPLLADRMIFKLINNRQVAERDFARDLNCCYLNESGRRTILREWDARLRTTIEHRGLKRKVSYERLIRLECYKLVKHLTNVQPYCGFRAWW